MIEVKNVEKSFGDSKVLKGITTTFETGKTNLIIGQSGSGKTVLLWLWFFGKAILLWLSSVFTLGISKPVLLWLNFSLYSASKNSKVSFGKTKYKILT